MRARGWMGAVAIVTVATACGSEINVFQETTATGTGGAGAGTTGGAGPGVGGAGGTGAGETTSVGAGGQGGGVRCTDDIPCLIDAVCSEGYCDPSTNTCAIAPLPAGTPCGDDSSCDGNGNCAQGSLEWAKIFGDGDEQVAHDVAADSQGNAVIVGYYQGTIDFGGGVEDSGFSQDAYVAKFDTNGNHLWSHVFPGQGADWAWDVMVDSADNVLVLGYFNNFIDLGGGPLASAGQRDIFVAKYDSSGALQWAKRYGGSADELPHTLAVSATGSVAIAGYWTNGILSFGPNATHINAGNLDVFVALLDANGNYLWSKSAGSASEQRLYDVAFDANGNVFVSGWFGGSIDFGGGAHMSAGQADAFIAKLDGNGGHVWSKRYGDAASQFIRGLEVDAAGNVVVAGYTDGSIDFGGGALTSSDGYDVFVARLDPAGNHLDSKIFPGDGDAFSRDLAVGAGTIVVDGIFDGNVDFGGGPMTTAGNQDTFAFKLADDFTHLWSRSFGDPSGASIGHGIALDGNGAVFVTGYLVGSIDFGMGPVSAAGQEDAYLAKLSP